MGRRLVLAKKKMGAEREEWENLMEGEGTTKLCQALDGGLFCLWCRAQILKAFRMKDVWVLSNQQLLA